jgi:hypothetical protein
MDFTRLDMEDEKVFFPQSSQVREVLLMHYITFLESGTLELAGPDFRDVMGQNLSDCLFE